MLYLYICLFVEAHNNYGIYKKGLRNGTIFYYLEHSVRKGSKVGKKTTYLGKKIPSNIDKLKIEIFRVAYKSHFDDHEIIIHYNALEKSQIKKEPHYFLY